MVIQKSGRVQCRFSLQKPLFDRLFAYLYCSAPSTWSKSGLQKKRDTHSYTIRPNPEVGGSSFRTPKTAVSPQVAPKTGPATKSQILLTTRLMSTSGALTHLHSLEVAPSAQKTKHQKFESHSIVFSRIPRKCDP